MIDILKNCNSQLGVKKKKGMGGALPVLSKH